MSPNGKSLLLTSLAAATLVAALSACAPLIIGGAAVGTMVIAGPAHLGRAAGRRNHRNARSQPPA